MLGRNKQIAQEDLSNAAGESAPESASQGMLRRISESTHDAEVVGLRNMAWKPVSDSPLAPPILDMDWLIAQPLLPYLVQVTPAPVLYSSLMAHGLEDSLEVVEWIRGEQLVRLLDFDLWTAQPGLDVEDISTDKAMTWFRLWLEIGPEFAADRVFDLEEETLVSLFSKIFDIQPIGLSDKREEYGDEYWVTPEGRFALKPNDPDPETFEILHQLMRALYGKDVRLASSLIGHATMLIRQESLEEALRWRAARLADVGFVTPEEARHALVPRPLSLVREEVRNAIEKEKAVAKALNKSTSLLSESTLARMGNQEIDPELLAGVIHTLQQFDPDEGYQEIVKYLGQSEVILLAGSSQPMPELVMEDADIVNEAAEKIVAECHRVLAFVQALPFRQKKNVELVIEEAFAQIAEDDVEKASLLKARVARISNTVLAAVQGGFENDALARVLTVTRGCLNIGLEMSLLDSESLGIAAARSPIRAEMAAEIVLQVGPEFLFQLGWQTLMGLEKSMAEALATLVDSNDERYSHLKFKKNVVLSDGSEVSFNLEKFLQAGRFSEVRAWLSEIESDLDGAVHLVLSSVLNRIPLFPELLSVFDSESANPTLVSAVPSARRAFCTVADVSSVQRFISELPFNVVLRG